MDWKKRNIRNVHLLCTDIDESNINKMLDEARVHDARSIITCDFEGRITRFNPSKAMTWGTVWYVQNLMIMQRLHQVDAAMSALKSRGVI